MITGIAHKVYTMTTDAPDTIAFISGVDSLSDENGDGGLDSQDLGDALGYLITYLESEEWSGNDDSGSKLIVFPDGFTATISYEWEPFAWKGFTDPDDLDEYGSGGPR